MPKFQAHVEWQVAGTVVVDALNIADAKDKLAAMPYTQIESLGAEPNPDSFRVRDVVAARTIKSDNTRALVARLACELYNVAVEQGWRDTQRAMRDIYAEARTPEEGRGGAAAASLGASGVPVEEGV